MRQLVTLVVLTCDSLLGEAIAEAFFTEVKIIHPVVSMSCLGIDCTPTPQLDRNPVGESLIGILIRRVNCCSASSH